MEVVIGIAFVLGIIRMVIGLYIPPEPITWIAIYKDLVHVFMGGLFMSAWITKRHWQWQVFWALCALEVTVAVLSR